MAPTPRPFYLAQTVKQGFWRGQPHLWSNAYWLSGSPTPAQMLVILSTLAQIESQVFPPVVAAGGVGFVEAKGYASGLGSSIATVPFNTSLAASTATGYTGPSGGYTTLVQSDTLEVCLGVDMLLAGLCSRGKPVYTRKFFRGAGVTVGEADHGTPIGSADLAKINATVLPWKTGMGPLSTVVIGKSGKQAQTAPTAQSYLTNHQVPRGRKKKSVGSSGSDFSAIISAAKDIASAASSLGSDG